MVVELKRLNNPKNIASEFTNKIIKVCGITQDPKTKDYMLVILDDKCKKCDFVCHTRRFQQNFQNWTSGNYDIDSFIQNTQLSAHGDVKGALEWIPYNRLYDIKYIIENKFGKIYRANWIDGNINSYWSGSAWDHKNQNWLRFDTSNMFVNLKSLNTLNNLTLEFMNEINRACGITQDPETKNYLMVLSDGCKKCNKICNAIYFQQKFINWTSGNDDIDNFIRNTQLSAHNDTKKALEWIPYDRLYDIKYITENKFGKVYRANWIDGNINSYWDDDEGYWDYKNQNWKRLGTSNMFV
ncbi:hypothetical protein RclHR1_43650001, partial [Rhizophagus clarus]